MPYWIMEHKGDKSWGMVKLLHRKMPLHLTLDNSFMNCTHLLLGTVQQQRAIHLEKSVGSNLQILERTNLSNLQSGSHKNLWN